MADPQPNLQLDCQQRLLRFISGAVHDLVGPVDQVGSLAGLLVRRFRGETDPEALALLQHIEAATARLSVTASALRAYFETARAECNPVRVDPRIPIQSALLALHFEIQQCQARIDVGELPAVEGDARLLATLFQALIQNALKFRRPDEPPGIRISAERLPGICRFFVADQGIGIDPEFREEIFQPFRKLNGHEYPGAGLGLAVARAISEAHRGNLRLADSPGPGATFLLDLPPASD
jgi:light-regulated signal transduction histidine kinase (bacteriophytochrome)